MNTHKDLPSGSQAWARELDDALKEIKRLQGVVQRLADNAGIDAANPRRGLNSGATPSVKNPVGQKLSSLADVATYDVLDGQVLSWSQQGQKWLPTTSAGLKWELATEEEHLWGDLDADSDYYTTQVIGLKTPYPPGVDYTTGGTGDSYGLVGTSNTSAFLHGAQRSFGGPTKAHGFVVAQPYYCRMGVTWVNDETSNWSDWGSLGIDRDNVYLQTPMGGLDYDGEPKRDGYVAIRTNWFYAPQVNGVMDAYFSINYPKRPVPEDVDHPPTAGAMVYDVTLKKPIWWEGTKWVDANGDDIPAALY